MHPNLALLHKRNEGQLGARMGFYLVMSLGNNLLAFAPRDRPLDAAIRHRH